LHADHLCGFGVGWMPAHDAEAVPHRVLQRGWVELAAGASGDADEARGPRVFGNQHAEELFYLVKVADKLGPGGDIAPAQADVDRLVFCQVELPVAPPGVSRVSSWRT